MSDYYGRYRVAAEPDEKMILIGPQPNTFFHPSKIMNGKVYTLVITHKVDSSSELEELVSSL